MQLPRDFLRKSERVSLKALVSAGHVSSVNIPKNLEYTASVVLHYKKLFQKDFRQAAMDTYSRTMHANEITTSWKLFCPVSYTMPTFLVFPPLSFSKGNSLGQGCMRDGANKGNSANCCDQSYFVLYCYNGRYNLIIDHNITLLFI